jgi:3-hydroxyacyl-CoA dehydrogenase
MNRIIKKVAIIGSGIMGSRIACHFANINCEVLLLDIQPSEFTDIEIKNNTSKESEIFKNRIVNDSLNSTINSTPSPLYLKTFASNIKTGNITDDIHLIENYDWVIEVIIERLDLKIKLFDEIEKYRKNGTLISSNTSGIPINLMLKGRSDDFKAHFCGTHFFNPPRYLPLLELIPTNETKKEIIDFIKDFGSKFLGKKTIVCKDTPAFIANRIGVYSIMSLFHVVEEMNLTVDEVDKLTGTILGRPKSATFRTCDVVGLDTLIHVANGLRENCKNDEENSIFILPEFISKMSEKNYLGSKTKQGFYKKSLNNEEKSEILSLNLKNLEYHKSEKVKFPTLEIAKSIDNLKERTKILLSGTDKAGEFYRKIFAGLFAYISNRIPEISNECYKIDDALKTGFGWELGPFETWDVIGFEQGLKLIESFGKSIPNWLIEMKNNNISSFYKVENNQKLFYNQIKGVYEAIPDAINSISLDILKKENTIWKNNDATVVDLGDGILNLEFHTKMNTIGGGVIEGINKAIDLAEKNYKGLVISNTGQNFSAGANVAMIFMMAIEQDYDELNFAIKTFQNTMMRLRYSSIPVVVAPHNLTLGGGCELAMHSDKVVAHSELYMGLVEFGVGLIPGGGGSKEFAKRLSDEIAVGDVKINRLRERFLTIGQAKVSTSAHEAFELGYLRNGIDEIVMNKEFQLKRAKQVCLDFVEKGYVAPNKNKNITVLGQEGLGIVYVGANSMVSGNYMSEHDQTISEKLGYVLCGGDLSENTLVSEQYLLDLERKSFVELCQKKKTLERLESLLKSGKILRN